MNLSFETILSGMIERGIPKLLIAYRSGSSGRHCWFQLESHSLYLNRGFLYPRVPWWTREEIV
jgi:hypothetical protein